ncbi:MAG: hypothetical protein AAGN66_29130 [Acidobacteriota bacterium]
MGFTAAEWVGSAGVSLLLAAFFLNLAGRLEASSRAYAGMNAVGAAAATASAWMIGFLPFVVLEGTWCLVALWSLLRGPKGGR